MRHELLQGDCLNLLPLVNRADCIFADPPDNIGLGYDQYEDRLANDDYVEWLKFVVEACAERAPIVWMSFNAKWTFAMGSIFSAFLAARCDWEGKACTQVFTFGQHNKNDLGNNHRPLWRLKHKDAPLYPDQIKVPSWRQRNGDKRAAAGGRVPGDVLDMAYHDEKLVHALLGAPIQAGDVFDFPRVTGNSKQRCDWHPTQLHEELVERCIKLSTKEGDRVLDPFGGTGTTMRVCRRIGRDSTLIEMDQGYCQNIASEQGLTLKGEGYWCL